MAHPMILDVMSECLYSCFIIVVLWQQF